MALTANQKNAFIFLRESFQNGTSFTQAEMQTATGWSDASFHTYFEQQFTKLLLEYTPNHYHVTEVFRKLSSEDVFENYILAHNKKIAADYNTFSYSNLIVFEFFLPLTNEGILRSTLDSLFYKDTILNRLKVTDAVSLDRNFPRREYESQDNYYDRVMEWIATKFIGYSISNVNGKFRAANLQSVAQSAHELLAGGRYLIDETTAVVKFIFPIGEAKTQPFIPSAAYFDQINSPTEKDNTKEADMVRWFFYILFVQSIVQVVNGDDEIWMMESGLKNKLHVWRVNR